MVKTMRVVDTLTTNNHIAAYCVGEDIPIGLNCKRVNISGKEFDVLKAGMGISLTGKKHALLALDVKSEVEIPLGPVIIIE